MAILEEAMVWGDSITQEAQAQLATQLQQAIATEGVAGAVGFCQLAALPLLAELEVKHGVSLRRVSTKARNPKDKPDTQELPLLDAYAYNAEEGIPSESSIQKLDKGEVLLYTKPIVLAQGMCLSCHGSIDKDIAPETTAKLTQFYPQDPATGYAVGDLRGMWSLRLPKKEVVKRL